MSEFAGKIVWITGASSGIGAALAQAFSTAGARIILSGRRGTALQDVAARLNTDTLILPFEVTDHAALPDAISKAWDWNGRVDILINNAGISQRSLAVETDPAVHSQIIAVDLIAPIWLTQLNLARMVAAGGGHIVGISSVAGRVGVPMRTAYCAAKHGLIGYLDSLRSEVEVAHNIFVTAILPGSFATDVARNALSADGKVRGASDPIIDAAADPAECAAAIVEAVANREPERIIAYGIEAEICRMRHAEPERLFALAARMGEAMITQYGLDTTDN
ncbi:MAG: SDR family NAD(P)-dependent oxidoreductase [Parasphingorhabdus sp.]|nr:SDR family NAD(P)-dependent oxidoreductase [Parasphingorhabdus sp.]